MGRETLEVDMAFGEAFMGASSMEPQSEYQSQVLHIVYATDDGYLLPTFVAAASALAWAADKRLIAVHVLDTGITMSRWCCFEERLRARFGKDFGLERHAVDLSFIQGFKKWHGSCGTYARLLLPEILAGVHWCVYCDGDTLFTEDPLQLKALFDPKSAIQGHGDWQVNEGASVQQTWFLEKGLGWAADQYLCAGFLLINLDWFRRCDGQKKCLDFVCRYADVHFPDQDALNYVCRGAIGILPNRWGCFSWDAFRDGCSGCLHYASDLPWKLMTNRYLDYNDAHRLWFFYADKLLGIRFDQIVDGGWGSFVLFRKLVWRGVFKMIRILCPYVPFLLRSPIGNYCLRHYASARQWCELTNKFLLRECKG